MEVNDDHISPMASRFTSTHNYLLRFGLTWPGNYLAFLPCKLYFRIDTHVNRSTISVIKYTVASLLHHLAAHIFVQIEVDVSALVALT